VLCKSVPALAASPAGGLGRVRAKRGEIGQAVHRNAEDGERGACALAKAADAGKRRNSGEVLIVSTHLTVKIGVLRYIYGRA